VSDESEVLKKGRVLTTEDPPHEMTIDCGGVTLRDVYDLYREQITYDITGAPPKQRDIKMVPTENGFKIIKTVERKLDEEHGDEQS
jgi:hypothetical protein